MISLTWPQHRYRRSIKGQLASDRRVHSSCRKHSMQRTRQIFGPWSDAMKGSSTRRVSHNHYVADHTKRRQCMIPNANKSSAIKTADQILKKNPGHGETEAMKALTMNSQGKQADEGTAIPLWHISFSRLCGSHLCLTRPSFRTRETSSSTWHEKPHYMARIRSAMAKR